MSQPLQDILVLDLSQFLSGPCASLRLADLGARVIKVEHPERGDICRSLYVSNLVMNGESSLFHAINRNKESFAVDLARSVDKRRQAELDRFGYRSLHYICAPAPSFFEQHGFVYMPELRFEVQLRTILQHAWAEMEHDLGYKAPEAIPAQIRRRFSRLAGLLELADEEFLSIKQGTPISPVAHCARKLLPVPTAPQNR